MIVDQDEEVFGDLVVRVAKRNVPAPRAAFTPALRALPRFVVTGSTTTCAPCSRATAPVRSWLLLSTAIISASQPRSRLYTSAARFSESIARPMYFSSFHAGTMIGEGGLAHLPGGFSASSINITGIPLRIGYRNPHCGF